MKIEAALKSRSFFRILSVLLALILWQILATRINMDMMLASPIQVLERLFTIWREPDFFSTLFFSWSRIMSGFLLAFLGGFLMGTLAGALRPVELLLWPYVTVAKTVPIASFIILCLLWLNYSQMTVFIAFLIAFPVIYANVLQGIRSTDPKLNEVASFYRIPWYRKYLFITLPSVKPYLISACGVAIGMAWKAGVAAEVIGIIDGSIGEKLYEGKIYFLNADLLSWTLILILLSVLNERLFSLFLKGVFRGVQKL
ncbi:MAG: ABC transporter permease subunit [Clostridia bacterium]|nr:ABC transporter permease subunit [Clostridia bacterium]MBQ4290436.1 ABC transporter permease subunit [Clostridia bacterium]